MTTLTCCIAHSGTQHAQTLINALFQQNIDNSSETVRRDHTYDYDTGQGPRVDNDPFGELVREKLSKIFRRKGAIVMQAPLLMPQSSIYGSRKAGESNFTTFDWNSNLD